MELTHIIQSAFIIINLAIVIYMLVKFARCKSCEKTLDMLNKNMDFLNTIYMKQHSTDLKKMIELYSEVQTVLKISEASFISLFRYDFSRTYITLHFMFSINSSGEIMHESYLDKLPATSNMLNLEILKSDGMDLYDINVESIKDIDMKVYELVKYRGIEKIYYRNITNSNSPLGYLAFSYPDNYKIDDGQREEIMRITAKISELL